MVRTRIGGVERVDQEAPVSTRLTRRSEASRSESYSRPLVRSEIHGIGCASKNAHMVVLASTASDWGPRGLVTFFGSGGPPGHS
jgi:hypothetical protein